MSQAIKKLQEGGAAEKPSTKTYDYLGKLIDQDQFIRDALQGASKFAYEESGVINRRKQDEVYDRILNLVELAKKGDLDKVIKEIQITSDIHSENKKIGPVELAARYIDQVIQNTSKYKEKNNDKEKEDEIVDSKQTTNENNESLDVDSSLNESLNSNTNESFNQSSLSSISESEENENIIFAKNGVQALWRKNPNYSDIQAGDTNLWDEWYNITDEDLINYLNSTNLTQTNIDALNGVTTDNFGNKVYNKRGYQSWNENYNNTGLNEFFGYSDKVNDYLGPSTWNRYKVFERLKTLVQNNPVNVNNGTISVIDGKFIFDPKVSTPKVLPEQSSEIKPETKPENEIENKIGLQSPQENIFDKTKEFKDRYINEFPGLIRLIGTLHTNNVAANKTIDSIRPPMRDPINLQRQVKGDYATQYAYENQGNRFYQTAKQGQTSDAELNNRTMLTAADQASEKKLQGDLLYNQGYRDAVEKAWQAEAQNKQERNQVAWDNLVRFRDAMKAKSDIQNARYLANWKSIHDFIAEKEYLHKSKNQALNQLAFQKERNQLLNEMTWDPDQIKLNKLMSQEVISDADYNEINRLRKVLSERYDERPFELERKYLYAKRGTKITVKKDRTHSDRTFHKAIKDTRDAHLKLLDNLSAVTKHLILKAMT